MAAAPGKINRSADPRRLCALFSRPPSEEIGMFWYPRLYLALAGVICVVMAMLFNADFLAAHLTSSGQIRRVGIVLALRIMSLVLGLILISAAIRFDVTSRLMGHLFGSPSAKRWTLFLTPIAIILIIFLVKLVVGVGDAIYRFLTTEDGIVEWLTALAFFAGFFFACRAAWYAYVSCNRILVSYFVLLALFCIFVGLEEISYGQRIFGFGTPDTLAEMNKQDEFNIHNIEWLDMMFFVLGPIAIGVFGIFGIAIMLLRPMLDKWLFSLMRKMVPPWYLSSWFAPYALFTVYNNWFWESWSLIEWVDSEVAEAFVAFGFAGFLAWVCLRLKPHVAAQKSDERIFSVPGTTGG